MTDKKRVTAYIPEELETAIWELKTDPRFVRMTMSDLIQYLIQRGLEANAKNEKRPA